MKITYTAFDGKVFTTQIECVEYERKALLMPLGWTVGGKQLTNIGEIARQAHYVYFPTAEAAQEFIRACEEQEQKWGGIDEWASGFYMWEEGREEFIYIPTGIFNFAPVIDEIQSIEFPF